MIYVNFSYKREYRSVRVFIQLSLISFVIRLREYLNIRLRINVYRQTDRRRHQQQGQFD